MKSRKIPKHVITIDFETYFDSEYSLTQMPVPQYVDHRWFHIHMLGIKLDDDPAQIITDREFGLGEPPWGWRDLGNFPWNDAVVVGHNLNFDAYILEHICEISPAAYFCTYQGARPFYAQTLKSLSLGALSEAIGIGKKGDELINTKNKSTSPFSPFKSTSLFSPEEWQAFQDYCIQDVNLAYHLYLLLESKYQEYCPDELELIDHTIKQFVRPQLELNLKTIEVAIDKLDHEKLILKEELAVTAEELRSDAKFAELLIARGLPEDMVPKKVSPTTGKEVYAFSKTDREFLDLRNDPEWAPYVAARLAFKSSLESSRLQRLRDIGQATGGILPAPILYYGAHTGRFSGTDKINLQNMPRDSVIREAIIAPPFHLLIAADLAQIEARMTACLAGQDDLVEAFAKDIDVYADFAADVYKLPITKEKYPRQRFVGKTAILSMQYQVGHKKFHSTMNNTFHTHIELGEAETVVKAYRRKYDKIVDLWDELGNMVTFMATADKGAYRKLGPLRFEYCRVILPNGMPMQYPNLHWDPDNKQYIYDSGKGTVSLYGGKLLENLVQACCRIIMTTAQIRLARYGKLAALSVHDELIYVVEADDVFLISKVIQQVMEYPVDWMPDLPIKCEVAIGRNYSECK